MGFHISYGPYRGGLRYVGALGCSLVSLVVNPALGPYPSRCPAESVFRQRWVSFVGMTYVREFIEYSVVNNSK